MGSRFSSYWVSSAGLAIAWALVVGIGSVARPASASTLALVFGGFAIGWVSTTIARYVYPPPRRWTGNTPAAHPRDHRR
ncbi:MAG: hypothetical protein HIU86_05045 [Acidobacteria bacterium]|nr:hypothetical protein [Acidobacteriota bacterium]